VEESVVALSLRAFGTYLLAIALVGVGALFGGPTSVSEAALAPSGAYIYEGGGYVGISPSGPFVGQPGDSLQTFWDSGSDGCCIRLTLVSGPGAVGGIGAPGSSIDGCCGWQPVLNFPQAGTYHFSLVWVPQGGGAGPQAPPQNTATFDVVIRAPAPTSADQCKNGGWQSFGNFKNQGDCVSFIATKGKNQPAG
jgi:hypothetical protein